jgi:hypothetical protein
MPQIVTAKKERATRWDRPHLPPECGATPRVPPIHSHLGSRPRNTPRRPHDWRPYAVCCERQPRNRRSTRLSPGNSTYPDLIRRNVHRELGARRRVSRVLSRPRVQPPGDGDGHSSGTLVAERLVRPTRAAARRLARHTGSLRDACRSYLVLLPVGFSLPPPLPAVRCALTAPFHPCRPPGMPRRAGGVFSVALSLGSPPPGVTRHRASVEPGLSSPRATAESGHPTVWRGEIWVASAALSKPPPGLL